MQKSTVVLLVEDEIFVRMDIADQLTGFGLTVLEAGTASEAIQLLDANPGVEVLFTDIDMPGTMDGLMLAAAVRDRWPPIKIIVTSGHREVTQDDLPDKSRFLQKPYTIDLVVQAVQKIMA